MKPVRIDFVRSTAYHKVWGVTLLLTIVLIVGFVWTVRSMGVEHAQVAKNVKELEVDLRALRSQAETRATSAHTQNVGKQRQLGAVAVLLQTDFGKSLRTLETLQIPGVRVRSFSIDNGQGTIEIELELPSLSNVVVASEALGAGYPTSPWVLLGTVMRAPSALSEVPGGANTGLCVGRWRAQLALL